MMGSITGRRSAIGQSSVEYKHVQGILTKPSGFADFFDFTLNPYSGCTFGCNYCYAAFFAKTEELKNNWGKWIQVKENALELLRKYRKKPLIGKNIYMSTVTDPYQPIEKEIGLTQAILEELLGYHDVRLVVQTRGTLVTRDIDLLRRFKYVQVNMTITTDDETVRRQFEPMCPSMHQRLDAIQAVNEAGIQSCITMTPLLPVKDAELFADQLLATGIRRFVIQEFHAGHSRFVASTDTAALALAKRMNWSRAQYLNVLQVMQRRLPNLKEGKIGFIPVWLDTDIG